MNSMAQSGRHRGRQYDASPAARYDLAIDAHEGSPLDFVGRLQAAAREAGVPNSPTNKEFIDRLFEYTSDERNIMIALAAQRAKGGGPGIDGLSFSDLPPTNECWPIGRERRDALRDKTWRPQPLLSRNVPKGQDGAKRPIHIPVILDRVVGAAVVQAILFLLEGIFFPWSFAYRPNRDRRHAIAYAYAVASALGRWFWWPLDIANAFPSVPRRRLLDVVEYYMPNEQLVKLISMLIEMLGKHGIPPGQPVCPPLFNLYLHHMLERLLRRNYPEIQLIRASDNLLLLCDNREQALKHAEIVRGMLRNCGMKLGTDAESAIADLKAGTQTEWLGFNIRKEEDSLQLAISERSWTKLEQKLRLAHQEPDAPLRVPRIVTGWVRQTAPAVPEVHQKEVLSRVTGIARECAFEELPSQSELETVCLKAYRDWDRIKEEQRSIAIQCLAGGSAAKDRFSAAGRRRAGKCISPVPPPAASLFTLHTDGCCLPNGTGGWAYVITTEATRELQSAGGAARGTTNNRMELTAVITGLRQVPSGTTVTLVTDSKYVADGITQHLPTWRNRRWKCGPPGKRRRLVNADLWEQLSDLVQEREVHVAFVRGHSGDEGNEHCDRLAYAAAVELNSKTR